MKVVGMLVISLRDVILALASPRVFWAKGII